MVIRELYLHAVRLVPGITALTHQFLTAVAGVALDAEVVALPLVLIGLFNNQPALKFAIN